MCGECGSGGYFVQDPWPGTGAVRTQPTAVDNKVGVVDVTWVDGGLWLILGLVWRWRYGRLLPCIVCVCARSWNKAIGLRPHRMTEIPLRYHCYLAIGVDGLSVGNRRGWLSVIVDSIIMGRYLQDRSQGYGVKGKPLESFVLMFNDENFKCTRSDPAVTES